MTTPHKTLVVTSEKSLYYDDDDDNEHEYEHEH